MDTNWRPTQGSDPAAIAAGVDPNAAAPAGGEWRAQLQPEARSRIVNKIMEALKKHLPVSVPEGLNELQKIAVRFEEKIYTAATNQSDYLRKISLKMLSMETKTQQAPGNAQVIPNQNNSGPAPGLPPQCSNQAHSSAIPLISEQQAQQPNTSASIQASSLTNIGQNLPGVSQTFTLQNVSVMPQNTMNNGLAQGASQDIYAAQRQMLQIAGRQQQQQQSASVDSTAQTGHAGAGDWQEEIYQMIKSLKDQYFAELSELYNKISVKLQHVDSMTPPQKPSEQYERMKSFKIMLERMLQILQVNKSNIQPTLREKIPQFEKQIISILNSQRRKPVQQTQGQQQFQPPAGQAPS